MARLKSQMAAKKNNPKPQNVSIYTSNDPADSAKSDALMQMIANSQQQTQQAMSTMMQTARSMEQMVNAMQQLTATMQNAMNNMPTPNVEVTVEKSKPVSFSATFEKDESGDLVGTVSPMTERVN